MSDIRKGKKAERWVCPYCHSGMGIEEVALCRRVRTVQEIDAELDSVEYGAFRNKNTHIIVYACANCGMGIAANYQELIEKFKT